MSLLGLFSLIPLLPISAQDIADQHPLPDSIGSKMKYNASIEMKKGYLSGICMLIRDKDGYKGSIFNEFGISVLDFTYQPVTGKVKLENVIQLLDNGTSNACSSKISPRLSKPSKWHFHIR